jgi:hypothetical protein
VLAGLSGRDSQTSEQPSQGQALLTKLHKRRMHPNTLRRLRGQSFGVEQGLQTVETVSGSAALAQDRSFVLIEVVIMQH